MRILVALAALSISGGAIASAQTSRPPPGTSITEAHARSILTDAGCTQIGNLSADNKGAWHTTCWKGGQPTAMMVDPSGNAMPDPGTSGLTEAHARSALTDAGCTQIGNLSADTRGNWHTTCWKGGQPTAMMVDQSGKVSGEPEGGLSEISEASARSILTDSGCTQIGNLSRDQRGMWRGTCWKGGEPKQVAIDQSGTVKIGE